MLRELLEKHIKTNWNLVLEYRSNQISSDRRSEIEDVFYTFLAKHSKTLNKDLVLPIIRNRLRFMV